MERMGIKVKYMGEDGQWRIEWIRDQNGEIWAFNRDAVKRAGPVLAGFDGFSKWERIEGNGKQVDNK